MTASAWTHLNLNLQPDMCLAKVCIEIRFAQKMQAVQMEMGSSHGWVVDPYVSQPWGES